MAKRLVSGAIALMLVWSTGAWADALDMTCEVKAAEGENYARAFFRLWLPQEADTLRGLVVLVPGLNENGLYLADVETWRVFAREERFGLVACYFQGRLGRMYQLAGNGSAQGLLRALETFAAWGRREDLKDAPLLLWGHGAGGEYCYGFAAWAPERVIAFASVRGQHYRSVPRSETWGVPAVLVAGEKDSLKRLQGMTNAFFRNRPRGALWCLAIELDAHDEVGRSADLVIPFFKSVAARRLPKMNRSLTYSDLEGIEESDGWVADIRTKEMASWNEYLGPRERAVWLPDAAFAQAWLEFTTSREPASRYYLR